MTDQPATVPTIECACCGQVLDARWQPPLRLNRDGMWLVSCHNPACDLYQYTFSNREYPPEKLFERYGVTR